MYRSQKEIINWTNSIKKRYSKMNIAIVFCVIIVAVCSTKFPPSFKKCRRKDPNASKCYLEAAQNVINQLTQAYPQVNLPNFEPLEITELNVGAGLQRVVNVEQNYKNCKIYGISEAKVDDIRFDFDEKYADARAVIANLTKICHYELNGKILLLPVVGSGQSTTILKNVKIGLHFGYEEVKKKGKTYMNFNTQKISLDAESISYNFENLFNGDRALGDNINKVLNENDKEVFEDVKQGYEEGIGLILMQVLHNLFAKVSIEEAFD